MVGWGLTIMTATSPLLVQLLYDYEEQEYHLSCEEIFSFEVTLPSWTCCVIISVVSFLLFIHAVMFFNKVQEKLNPAHALRYFQPDLSFTIEKQSVEEKIFLLLGWKH